MMGVSWNPISQTRKLKNKLLSASVILFILFAIINVLALKLNLFRSNPLDITMNSFAY